MGYTKAKNSKYNSMPSAGLMMLEKNESDASLEFVDFLEEEEHQWSDPTDLDHRYNLSDDLRRELVEWIHAHHP